MAAERGRVGLLMWGDIVEDYLEGIGLTLDDFCDTLTGGWLFGYVEALARAGITTVILCVSQQSDRVVRRIHRPTGTPISVLPATRAYRSVRWRAHNAYGTSPRAVFGDVGRPGLPLAAAAHQAMPYLATPVRALARELRSRRCSALLCQEYEEGRFDVSVLLGQLIGLPVYATFQGGTVQRTRAEAFLRPLTVRRCAGLVIAPRAEAERVVDRYRLPAERITRVFNPVEVAPRTSAERDAARSRLRIADHTRLVAWHGRVELEHKGLDVLADAWAKLRDRYSDDAVQLLLVGTGRDAPALHERVDALGGVRWMDEYVTDRRVLRGLLAAADIYVFPSRREGFAVAPLEAMALGLPVVAAAASGIRDLLPDGERSGGLVVAAGDADRLAAALRSLVEDEARRERVGRHAAARARACAAPEAVGGQLAGLLAGRPPPRARASRGREGAEAPTGEGARPQAQAPPEGHSHRPAHERR